EDRNRAEPDRNERDDRDHTAAWAEAHDCAHRAHGDAESRREKPRPGTQLRAAVRVAGTVGQMWAVHGDRSGSGSRRIVIVVHAPRWIRSPWRNGRDSPSGRDSSFTLVPFTEPMSTTV